jgi:hypothetical protein
VARIRNQRERIQPPARNRLRDRIAHIKRNPNRKRPIVRRGRVRVSVPMRMRVRRIARLLVRMRVVRVVCVVALQLGEERSAPKSEMTALYPSPSP